MGFKSLTLAVLVACSTSRARQGIKTPNPGIEMSCFSSGLGLDGVRQTPNHGSVNALHYQKSTMHCFQNLAFQLFFIYLIFLIFMLVCVLGF